MSSVTVAFCCNDDHGLPLGTVSAIDVQDEIRIVAAMRESSFRRYSNRNGNRLSVSRRHYDCGEWTSHAGNIFWDATTMANVVARSMLKYLIDECGWAVEEYSDGPYADLAKRPRVKEEA